MSFFYHGAIFPAVFIVMQDREERRIVSL